MLGETALVGITSSKYVFHKLVFFLDNKEKTPNVILLNDKIVIAFCSKKFSLVRWILIQNVLS